MHNAISLSAYEHFLLCDMKYFWVNFFTVCIFLPVPGNEVYSTTIANRIMKRNISNKIFSACIVLSSPHFITDDKSIVHIAHSLFFIYSKIHHQIFFRSAHMFKNSDCFGRFHYLSNALNLHCVNDNPFCQLCMDFLLSSKKNIFD